MILALINQLGSYTLAFVEIAREHVSSTNMLWLVGAGFCPLLGFWFTVTGLEMPLPVLFTIRGLVWLPIGIVAGLILFSIFLKKE